MNTIAEQVTLQPISLIARKQESGNCSNEYISATEYFFDPAQAASFANWKPGAEI